MRRRWRLRLVVSCGLALFTARATAENWPQFRGERRDNTSRETGLFRQWPADGPKRLWSVDVCEGYAAAAIYDGRVYFNDYDKEAGEWLVRCLSLADGKELWRYKEAKRVRTNHGITRTVPAVDGKYVFSLDQKCVFHCLDAGSGKELWRKDLVEEYKTEIPPWYNGQCPLIEPDRVVIATGGEALVAAFAKADGKEIWRTPNPQKWPLSHASLMPAELGGVKQYLWCTLAGPLGVSAADGKLLWSYARKFNVAVAASPLAVGDDRVFMTAGYEAGSVMLRVRQNAGQFSAEPLFDWTAEEWNSEVHTPILFQDHMFAVGRKKRGLFTCLTLDGKTAWTSDGRASFGLGSFLLADQMFFILDGDTGMLRLLEASTTEYHELAAAQVLSGHDVWGPMALSNGKLVLRDMAKMVCLEVGLSRTAQGGNYDKSTADRWDGTRFALAGLVASATDEPLMKYRQVRVISGKGAAPDQFAEELRGLALDRAGQLYAVGDSAVKVLSPDGKFLRDWPTAKPGYCVSVAADGRVFVGQEGQIEIFDRDGKLLNTWRDAERLGLVTAIGFTGDDVLAADVAARCIRRFDRDGHFRNDIGNDNRMKGFVVPNGHLDFAVDGQGVIHAANPGMHRIERYSPEGKLLGQFGRFDGRDPAGFGGCCNPTNVAVTPKGLVVVTEKAGPRAKIYDADGKLLAVMGGEDFDPACKNMDVAIDAAGKVYVADTERLHICVFAPDMPSSSSRPATPASGNTVKP